MADDLLATDRALVARMKKFLGHIEDMDGDERVFMLGALCGALDRHLKATADQPAEILRPGRSQVQTPGLVTLYRAALGDWKTQERVGMMISPELAVFVCEAVNARGIPLPASGDHQRRLLEQALFLRMNGERALGGNETWREWERDAETFLRSLPVRGNNG